MVQGLHTELKQKRMGWETAVRIERILCPVQSSSTIPGGSRELPRTPGYTA
jgi:hypothetical protein